MSGRTVWMLRTRNFPGPNIQKAAGDEYDQFFHMTSAQGLLGILKADVILPSATDRMGLPEDFPVSAFFSLLKHTRQQLTTEEIASECASFFVNILLGGSWDLVSKIIIPVLSTAIGVIRTYEYSCLIGTPSYEAHDPLIMAPSEWGP